MTDTNTAAPAATPSVQSSIMDIGTVAAHNIAAALGQGEDKVTMIRDAIRDEISAMSSHFTLAVADVQTEYELAVKKGTAELAAAKAKLEAEFASATAAFSYVKANKAKVAGAAAAVAVLGLIIGHFV